MADNPVTVVFTDGTELDVELLTRVIGADWSYARVRTEDTDEENEQFTNIDHVTLSASEIRYVRSDRVMTHTDSELVKIHVGGDMDTESARELSYDFPRAQQHLHPDDLPTFAVGLADRTEFAAKRRHQPHGPAPQR